MLIKDHYVKFSWSLLLVINAVRQHSLGFTHCSLKPLWFSVSLWTRSLLCRVGWMWLREIWTDSSLSMKCSSQKMDMGRKQYLWFFYSFLLLVLKFFFSNWWYNNKKNSLYDASPASPFIFILLSSPVARGISTKQSCKSYFHPNTMMFELVVACLSAGSVVCFECWKLTLSTNQRRVTVRHRGRWQLFCWWTCQLR